jgi:hypothetical protein
MQPERADDDDHWLRHVLEGGFVRGSNPSRVHANSLQKKILLTSTGPWAAELSGRLLSLATNIAAFAEEAAKRANSDSIKFRCVIYSKVATLRSDANVDVYRTPTTGDEAHADLVLYQVIYARKLDPSAADKLEHEQFRRLAAKLCVCPASDLRALETLRVP